MKILLIEDDPVDLILLKIKLKELGYDEPIIKNHTDDIEKAIESENPDIIISDIFFKKKPIGLSFISICEKKMLPIILVTSFDSQEVFDKSMQNNLVGFLVKPFHKFSLQSNINFLTKNNKIDQALKDGSIFISSVNKEKKRVRFDEIKYILSEKNYSRFVTNSQHYTVRGSLKSLANLLDSRFIQIHQATIVNKNYITKFTMDLVSIDEANFMVGRSFKKNISDLKIKK